MMGREAYFANVWQGRLLNKNLRTEAEIPRMQGRQLGVVLLQSKGDVRQMNSGNMITTDL